MDNNNENQNNENTGADNSATSPENSSGTTGTGGNTPNDSGVENPVESNSTDASQQPSSDPIPEKDAPTEPNEPAKTDAPAKEEGTASAEQVKVTFTGASKKTVEVARGSKLSEALKAAGIAQTTHTYRTAAGSDLSTTEAVNDNLTINVVKKASMG